ncbi:hypothetical protein V8C35DRAFT_169530 [Trichoderma chlorosporum]
MSLASEHVLFRTFSLRFTQRGRAQVTLATDLQELAWMLQLESRMPSPSVVVMAGEMDEATLQVLDMYGGGPDRGFVRAHAAGYPHKAYNHRAQLSYRWRLPQFLSDGCECADKKYKFAGGTMVLLSASLWVNPVPILLVSRPKYLRTGKENEETPLEEELALRGPMRNETFEGLVNQLVYERWLSLVMELRPCDFRWELLEMITTALEENYEQAREILDPQGARPRDADVEVWRELLRRMKRRVSMAALAIRPVEEARRTTEVRPVEDARPGRRAGPRVDIWPFEEAGILGEEEGFAAHEAAALAVRESGAAFSLLESVFSDRTVI